MGIKGETNPLDIGGQVSMRDCSRGAIRSVLALQKAGRLTEG